MINTEFLPPALALAEAAHLVCPIRIGRKCPDYKGLGGWTGLGSRHLPEVRYWFNRLPHSGFGVVTGEASAVVVVDIDGEEGRQSLADLVEAHDYLPYGPTTITARGQHRWFRWTPACAALKNRVGFRPGLDIRTTGGGVVVPPSFHPDGGRYRWRDVSLLDMEPPPLPDWLIEAIISTYPRQEPQKEAPSIILHSRFAEGALALAVRRIEEETEGNRAARINGEAYGIGKNIVAPKLCEERDAVAALIAAGVKLTKWPEKRVTAMVMSGMSAGIRDGELRHAV